MDNKDGKPEAITAKKSDNFSEWYVQALIKSKFVDYSAVSGMLVYRPECYFIWDCIKNVTDDLFKKNGIQDAYFPMLIPEKLFDRESEHVEGFAPEVAWVTEAGSSKLEERLAIRPTSETIIYDSYAKWIRSWRDLPLRLNQWCSVIRWEFKHPTPLLRTREFLWNEGHTVFATKEEADSERDIVLDIYGYVMKELLALPGIPGRKTDKEKFAGALASYSIELMMPDKWAIQGPDWHSDGQNFSKAFGIKFIDKEGKESYVYQNTFAITTRIIGALVAIHGDDRGLIIPPRVAMTQIVIVPIYTNNNRSEVMNHANGVYTSISGKFRTVLDDRDAYSPGWKFSEWELRGVPLRLEIGMKEVQDKTVRAVRRDDGTRLNIVAGELPQRVQELLGMIHSNLYDRARALMDSNTHAADSYDELKQTIKDGGFAQSPWCGSEQCEQKIKDDTGAKATNMPFNVQGSDGKKCVVCGSGAKYIVNFAKSY